MPNREPAARSARPRDLVLVQPFELPSTMAHAVQVLGTAAALARRGRRVHLFPRVAPEADAREVLREDHALDAPPELVLHVLRARHKGLAGLAERAGLLERLVVGGADFWTRHRGRTLELLRARRLLRSRARIVYELHNLEHVIAAEERGGRGAARLEREERRVAAGVDALAAISRPLADDALARLRPRGPVEVIPDGVDLARFRGVARADPGAERVRLVYAGGLYPPKGVDALVRALAELPERVELDLVGGNAPADLERLRALADSLPALRGRVRFAGQVPAAEVPARLAAADLIVLPMGEETRAQRYTSPLKLFEAMATGAPIVAAPAPSLVAVLEADRTAFVAASGAPADLAAAVRRALEDPRRAREVGRAAKRAAEAFGWDRRAERIEALLERLGSSPREDPTVSGVPPPSNPAEDP